MSARRGFRWWLGLIVVCLLSVFPATAQAQVAAGYSEYFIPGDEVGLWTIFDSLDDAGTDTDTHCVISVTAWSDDTIVYYDHWENGYGFDPADPVATADERVVLASAGDLQTFESAGIPTAPRGTGTYYDGGDRIYVAGGTVTVTRAGWIENVGVGNQSAAWEIYPIKPQLTTYVLPFGENLGFADFNRVYVLVQATADGTTFTVDLDGDGAADLLNVNRNATKSGADGDLTTVALNQGETFLLDRISACTSGATCDTAPGNLSSGTVVQGSSTLQVKFVAGNPGQNYCARGLSAFPRGYWTKTYYAPLDQPTGGGVGNTDYYLYNPYGTALTLDWQSRTGSGSFSIPAGSTVSFRTATGGAVPIDSGLYFSASETFWGVGIGNAGANAYEWGYSLLPSTFLYREHFLGWAPGSLPLDITGNPGNQDNVGVFLTVAQDNTRVFVDFDNDGAADLVDANLDGTPESAYVTLDRLQTQFFYDPANAAGGGDLSRAHFWSTGDFTMAYGENGDTATASTPSLDLGYVAIAGTDFISLVLAVDKSVSPEVVSTASGSVATFTLKVNSQKYDVSGVDVTDYLPPNWEYVVSTDTTTITKPDKSQVTGAGADPTITGTGPYTLGWSSAQIGGAMAENQEITIVFTARTSSVLAAGTMSQNRVKAVGTRAVGAETQTFSTTDFAYVVSGAFEIAKTSDAPTPAYPGDQFTYTATATNPAGGAGLSLVTLFDALPAGVTAVAGTTTLSRSTVADTFGAVAYTNNNGTRNWAGNWAETDIQGNVAGATAGFVRVTGDTLQFRNLAMTVSDLFSSTSYARNDGNTNWTGSWTETSDDNNANTGTIQVDNAGFANRVNFAPGTADRAITRTARVSGGSVTISFTLSDNGIDAGETLVAEYDLGLGAGFQLIQSIDGATGALTGANPLTVSTAGATAITIRFRAPQAWDPADNAGVDTLVIAYNDSVGSEANRAADLSAAANATLSFSYAAANLVAGDTVVVEASADGIAFTTLETLDGIAGSGARYYDLASPTNFLSATTTVRLRVSSGFNGTTKTFAVDNLSITDDQSVAGPNPPDLVPKEYCYALLAGQSLTATFDVTVDTPLPSGATSVTNTAAATSALYPLQITASVTDALSNPSALSASIAGRIWLDADGGADQDLGEPGIANVEVTLKDQFGTPVATTLTDANGRFIFTGVTAGAGYYVEATDGLPAGVSQSSPAPPPTDRTGAIDLSAGESRTGADLGYRPAGSTATFGDLVWVDADDDGFRDAGEVGLGGVTLTLYRDNNGDGVIDGGDTAIGLPLTSGPDGSYLFTGVAVAGGDDFLVAASTPAGYLPTGATQFRFIDVAGGTAYLNADFGYRGDTATTYSITDRVWKDANADGDYDSGTESGFPGVTVELLDSSLNVIGTTTTAADGTFVFSGVTGGNADYTVRINDTAGALTDYYGTTPEALALTRAEHNVNADVDNTASSPFGSFGFNTARSIGDTLFTDVDGNGAQDAGDLGIAGVVVSLYGDANGNGVVDGADAVLRTVTTDASGLYLFSGLANGGFIVSVPDQPGYGFTGPGSDSDGTTAGIQKGATIALAASVLTLDFGFQAATPRTASGTIWNDLDADGSIDPLDGEAGFQGLDVNLYRDTDGDGLIDAGEPLVGSVTSDASGAYAFIGLASGIYIVEVTDPSSVLTGYNPTFETSVGTTGPFNNLEPADLTGASIADLNFGFKKPKPTYAAIAFLKASVENGAVVVQWRTSLEVGTAGFHLLRRDQDTGEFVQLNGTLLPGLIVHPQGGTYRFVDEGAPLRGTLTYKLIEAEMRGGLREYGPFTVTLSAGNGSRARGRPGGLTETRVFRKPSSASRPTSRPPGSTSGSSGSRSARRPRSPGRRAPAIALKITTREEGLHYLAADQDRRSSSAGAPTRWPR